MAVVIRHVPERRMHLIRSAPMPLKLLKLIIGELAILWKALSYLSVANQA
jgi:hypothetical protein